MRRPLTHWGAVAPKINETQWNYVMCDTFGHEIQRLQCNVYTIFPSKPSGNDIFRKVSKYVSAFRSHTETVFIYSVYL
jgi:hypothetical protein